MPSALQATPGWNREPAGCGTVVTSEGSPPAAGSHRSSNALSSSGCWPRNSSPDPRTTASRSPEGDQAGLAKWAGCDVRRWGADGAWPSGAVQTAPPSASVQVTKATVRPSGDTAGVYSRAGDALAVRRRGAPAACPEARDWTQIRPNDSKTTDEPSGVCCAPRRMRASTGPCGTRSCRVTVGDIDSDTGAVNGIGSGAAPPDNASR